MAAPSNSFDRILRRFTFEGRLRGEIGLLLTLIVVASVIAGLGARTAGFEYLLLRPAFVAHGEVWRLLTWSIVAFGPTQLLFSCASFYFFATALGEVWGARRLLGAYFAVATLTGVVVTALGYVFPGVAGEVYDGAGPMASAFVVAWGLVFPHSRMFFNFVLPVEGRSVAMLTVAFLLIEAVFQGWAVVLPNFVAVGLLSLYIVRGRIAVTKKGGAAKAKRPSHLRAVRDDERWH